MLSWSSIKSSMPMTKIPSSVRHDFIWSLTTIIFLKLSTICLSGLLSWIVFSWVLAFRKDDWQEGSPKGCKPLLRYFDNSRFEDEKQQLQGFPCRVRQKPRRIVFMAVRGCQEMSWRKLLLNPEIRPYGLQEATSHTQKAPTVFTVRAWNSWLPETDLNRQPSD